MKLRKLMPLGGIIIATLAPIAATIGCQTSDNLAYERGTGNDISYIKKGFASNASLHKNVMSSYFNTTDMMTSLGYQPDFASLSGNTLYSNYLKSFLGKDNISTGASTNTGKITLKPAPRIMDGENVDREQILENEISTILLNEWEQVDETKFLEITPAIIYSSMADGKARFTDEKFAMQDANAYSLNVYEAFEMFAKGLDRAYPGHDFVSKAESIITKVKSNMKLANQAFQSFTANKSLLVVEVDKTTKQIKRARSTGVYTALYSKKEERGLGFDFPTPHNQENLKVNGFDVSAVDQVTFINEFKNAVDEIIVLQDPDNPDSAYNTFISNDAKLTVKDMIKDQGNFEKHINIVDRDEFYDSVWGIYGVNKFIKNMANLYKINVNFNVIDEFKDDAQFKILR